MNLGKLLCLIGVHCISWQTPVREKIKAFLHGSWQVYSPFIQAGTCVREGCGYATRREVSI